MYGKLIISYPRVDGVFSASRSVGPVSTKASYVELLDIPPDPEGGDQVIRVGRTAEDDPPSGSIVEVMQPPSLAADQENRIPPIGVSLDSTEVERGAREADIEPPEMRGQPTAPGREVMDPDGAQHNRNQDDDNEPSA